MGLKFKKNKKLSLMPQFSKCAQKIWKFFHKIGAYSPIFKKGPNIFEKLLKMWAL
jgi:hypothetical protein